MLSSLRLPLQRYVTGYPPVPRFVSRVKKRHRIAHTDPVAGDARFGVFFGKSDAELTHLSCPNFRSQGRTPTASVRYPGRRRRTSGVATRCAARTGVSGLHVSRVKKRHRIAHTDPVAGDARFGVFFGKSDAELTHLSCPNFRSQGRTPTASVRYPGRRRRTSGVATRCAARTGVSGLQRSVRRGVWSVLDGAMLTPSATRKLLTGSFSREIFWLSLEEASTCFSGACSEGNVTAPGGNQFWAFPRRDQHPLRRLISSVAACVSVLVTL